MDALRRIRINRVLGYTLFVLAMLAFGYFFRTQKYILHIGVLSLIFATLAVSLNLTNGYVGMFSIGHAAFYGIGAYASALVAMRLGMPFPISILAAGVICAGFGAFLATLDGPPARHLPCLDHPGFQRDRPHHGDESTERNPRRLRGCRASRGQTSACSRSPPTPAPW